MSDENNSDISVSVLRQWVIDLRHAVFGNGKEGIQSQVIKLNSKFGYIILIGTGNFALTVTLLVNLLFYK